jgi:hypothetical protein
MCNYNPEALVQIQLDGIRICTKRCRSLQRCYEPFAAKIMQYGLNHTSTNVYCSNLLLLFVITANSYC